MRLNGIQGSGYINQKKINGKPIFGTWSIFLTTCHGQLKNDCSPRCLPLRHLCKEVRDQIIHHCTMAICGKPTSDRVIQKHVGISIANPGLKMVFECHHLQQLLNNYLKSKNCAPSKKFHPRSLVHSPSSLFEVFDDAKALQH